MPIQLSGLSLLGGKSDERTAAAPTLAEAPLIHLRVFALLGGVSVKDRSQRRDLLEIIRSRKQQTDTET